MYTFFWAPLYNTDDDDDDDDDDNDNFRSQTSIPEIYISYFSFPYHLLTGEILVIWRLKPNCMAHWGKEFKIRKCD